MILRDLWRGRRRWLLAGAAAATAIVVVAALLVTNGGPGRVSRKPAASSQQRGGHPIAGSFRLTAEPGDGTVWLSWATSPGCGPATYRVERATDPKAGPWETADQNMTATSFKDVNRLNRMQLWYRVVGTDCRSHTVESDTVPVTPFVTPYSWDFGRQDEGLPGTEEGWTTGRAAAGGVTNPQSGSGPASTAKPKGRKKKKQSTTTTQTPQSESGLGSRQVVQAALFQQTGSTDPTTAVPGGKLKRRGDGQAGKNAAGATKGVLIVDAPPGNPTAVSPDGLNMPAATYKHLVVDVVGHTPPSLTLQWVITGQEGWSPPAACRLVVEKSGTARCEIKDLSATTHNWSGNIRRLEVVFPGATSPVRVDRIQFQSTGVPAPLVGAIRWDGWFPANVESKTVDNSLYTDFDYRQPFYGWFDEPGPATLPPDATHPSVLPQHQLDLLQEMQQAKAGGIDFWAFDWFLGSPEIPQSPPTQYVSALTDYETYVHGLRTGENPLLDYALILGPSSVSQQDRKAGQLATTPYWNNVLIPRLIEHFKESAYVKVDGDRPLVYWFGTKDLGTAAGFGNCSKPDGGCWRTALADLVHQVKATPGLGAPYFVDTTSDASSAVHFGFDGLSSYGPGIVGPVQYAPTPGQPWVSATQTGTPASVDDAVARQTVVNRRGRMLAIQPGLTPTLDHRPMNAGTQFAAEHQSPTTFWFEYPTYNEWETHLRSIYDDLELYPGRSSQPGVALIYAWNEVSEGGGIVPSAQYGAYLLDAVRAVRTGNYPSRYWDTWNDSNTAVIQYRGEWHEVGPSPDYQQTGQPQLYPTSNASGAYTNDEHLDPNGPANVADTAVIDISGATAVRLIATTGPDRGIARIDVDGQSTDVNLYAPMTTHQVIVFERDGLAKGKHRLTISATGRKDPRATASTIGVDAVSALADRMGDDATGPLAPNRVTAQGLAGQIALRWDPVPGATAYRIYRAGSFDGTWRQIQEVPATGQPLYEDTSVPSGMHGWYYQVRAIAGTAVSPASDVASAITTADLSQGGVTSSGDGPTGRWDQSLFAGGATQTFNQVVLASPPGQGQVTIEVTPDGGGMWKVVYRSHAPGDAANTLGDQRSITFPPASGKGIRVTLTGVADPPAFETYLR